MDKKTSLSDIFHNNKQSQNEVHENSSQSSSETISKHEVGNKQEFIEGREILGQIITKDMKATGGTDLDWVIERKGGFLIFEFKKISKIYHSISIPLAQMIVYENLNKELEKCHIFFIGYYKNTNFRITNEPLWYFEITNWKNSTNPIKYTLSEFTNSKGRKIKKYFIETKDMEQIDVERLQKKIEDAWNEFELKSKS